MSAENRSSLLPKNAVWDESSQGWIVSSVDKQGKKVGPCVFYRKSGSLHCKGFYEDDKLQGEAFCFFEDGQSAAQLYFEKGQLHGTQVFFDLAKQTKEREFLFLPASYGGILGLVTRYEIDFIMGEIIAFRCFNVKGQRICRDGKPFPFLPENVPKQADFLENHRFMQGRWKTKGNQQGDKEGLFRWWSQEGILVEQGFYQKGLLHGTFRTFYPNGTRKEETAFVKGKRQGPGYIFSINGNLLKEAEFANNQYHGMVKEYDQKGYLSRESKFENGVREWVKKYHVSKDKEGQIFSAPFDPKVVEALRGKISLRIDPNSALYVTGSLNLTKLLNNPRNHFLPLSQGQIPPEIAAFPGLSSFAVSNITLQEFPEELADLWSLSNLKLSNTGISSLDPLFTRMPLLEYLDLAENHFQEFPLVLCQLPQLIWLNLAKNQLRTLPSQVSQLRFLETLFLSSNPIALLPEELSQCSRLKHLHLSHTHIALLPKVIVKLPCLERLDLAFCELTQLPEELGQLSQLKVLDLTGNQIQTLPDCFSTMKQLETLYLSGNPLSRENIQGLKKKLPKTRIYYK